MSNPYRNIEAFEIEVRKRRMIEDAITTRYKQRGGEALDKRIAILDEVNATSFICRHSERVRLEKDANAMREKGERPVISVSETRLYVTKSEHLEARRDELLAAARGEIMTALDRVKPPTEEALRVVLDLELNQLTDETRKAMEAVKEQMRKEAEADEAQMDALALLLSQVPDLKDRAAMMECFREGDAQKFGEYFLRQPEEWRKKWGEATQKLNAE